MEENNNILSAGSKIHLLTHDKNRTYKKEISEVHFEK